MLVILCVVLFAFFGIRFAWTDSLPPKNWAGDPNPRSMSTFFGLAWRLGGIGAIAGVVVGGFFSMMVHIATVDDVPRRFDIVALGDGAGVEGRAFLGSGTVDTEAVFFYYAGRSGGGLGLFHVDANITSIYEDQTTDGYMIQYCEDAESGAKWLNLPLIDILNESSEEDRYDCSYPKRVEFHIPANSIDRSFNLDAQ